ncbi:hypothetical protein BU15DRAFT_67136 [Melanogaster broomeanus]|nr:hypothetical protein BU15DRAFT_67136 [Melanogaster broomeanus]
MATDPLSIFATLRLSEYLSLVIVTAIVYDYIPFNDTILQVLTFPRECAYDWRRYHLPGSDASKEQALDLDVHSIPPGPFSGPSFCDNCSMLCVRILNGSDARTIPNVWFHNLKGAVLYQVSNWSGIFFFAAVHLVLLLRVYAMYNRSRTILCILLVIYIPTVVLSFVTAFYKPRIDLSDAQSHQAMAIKLIFGIARSRRRALFSRIGYVPNELTSELFSHFNLATSYLFSVVVAIVTGTGVLQGLTPFLLYTFSIIPPIILPPCLILSIREFHSRIVGDHIDTGFGAISRHPISTNETMVFANASGPTETIGDYRGAEDSSEIMD